MLVGNRSRHCLQQRDIVQRDRELLQRRIQGQVALGHRPRFIEKCSAVACRQRFEQTQNVVGLDRTQHLADACLVDATTRGATVGDRLIEKAQSVAHRSLRRTRQHAYRAGLEGNALLLQHVLELSCDDVRRQLLQVELQAAREHGDRDLLGVGGREDELDVLRRLFKGLQHRSKRVPRQHVDFVDQVNLVAPDRRRIARGVENLAHVVDAGRRCGIELDQVDEAAFIDRNAGTTNAAGRRGDAGLAIERLGEDPRDGRLADAARSGEQVRVMQAHLRQRVGQRPDDVRLARELREISRAPFAGKDLIRHDENAWGEPDETGGLLVD